MATRITRRTLLRAGGTTSVALLLNACGNDAPDDVAASPEPAPSPTPDAQDISNQAVEAVGLDVTPTLTPIIATFEVLTGDNGRIPFGVLDDQQEPLLDRDVQLWLVRDGDVVAGPIEPLYYGEGLGKRGIYVAQVALDTPGLLDAVVQVDGDAVGVAALSVRDADASVHHPPGSEFPVVATPTEADPGDLETLCTRDPQCTMHDTSLEAALGTGPVVFTVSTPQFCQTAVCGPVVDVIEETKQDLGRDDVTFIHSEVYKDAGITPTDVVTELGLQSEPWTWVIGADGTVVDRFDGPVVPSLLRDAIDRA